MLLDPIVLAQALGVPTTGDSWRLAADAAREGSTLLGALDVATDLERAARARAVERYPLRLATTRSELDDDEPHDGGTDGCPPAAVRHVCAGALVASLATGCGFPYGEPPTLPLGAGPIRPLEVGRDEIAHAFAGEPLPPPRGRYEVAEAVLGAFCGMSTTRDVEGPTNAATYDDVKWARAAVDLAIDLLCDERHSVAEITAGAAAWMLATSRKAWIAGRVRRMLSLVGVRFPRG